MKKVLTYGTYDLLHIGHILLFERAKSLGDYLIVAVSTDEFNMQKGKQSYYNYEIRKKMVESIRYVDQVIPENDWNQKINDIQKYGVDVVVMGSDWENDPRFEQLRKYCDVAYLERTPGISTTQLKEELNNYQLVKTKKL